MRYCHGFPAEPASICSWTFSCWIADETHAQVLYLCRDCRGGEGQRHQEEPDAERETRQAVLFHRFSVEPGPIRRLDAMELRQRRNDCNSRAAHAMQARACRGAKWSTIVAHDSRIHTQISNEHSRSSG